MRFSALAGRLLAALLLVAAGCGGGDDSETIDTTTSTTDATTTTSSPTTTASTATSTTTAAVAATTATTKPAPATTTTTAPAKLSPTQFFVARPGCKNEIVYVRVGADRKVVQSKVVVKAVGNTQLIAYAERDDRLLFGTFNCDTNARALYELALTDPQATPRLIASDLYVVDADFDIRSDAVLVLTGGGDPEPRVVSIDSSGARAVRWTPPAAWKSAADPLARVSASRLRALTGGEMMIGGDDGGKFVVARVSADGYTSGGVTGDGGIGTFDISILQGAIALPVDGTPDLYLCAFGAVYGAGQPTPITSLPGCAGHPLPQGLTSLPAKVAWGFSGQDGRNVLLVIKNRPLMLDVESLDLRSGSGPPEVYGTAPTDVPYGVNAVAVYELDHELSETVPSVTI